MEDKEKQMKRDLEEKINQISLLEKRIEQNHLYLETSSNTIDLLQKQIHQLEESIRSERFVFMSKENEFKPELNMLKSQLEVVDKEREFLVETIDSLKAENEKYLAFFAADLSNSEKQLRGISVLDKSPFQEFTLQCLGSTEDPLRMAMLEGKRRKDAGKQMKFRYDPKGKPGKVPEYRFGNSSGNEILNKN
jgi:hypothetical protein